MRFKPVFWKIGQKRKKSTKKFGQGIAIVETLSTFVVYYLTNTVNK